MKRDQLWAKLRPAFESGGGVPSGLLARRLLDVCSIVWTEYYTTVSKLSCKACTNLIEFLPYST